MHNWHRLPPITVSCTDYNELVFALGVAPEGDNAAFLAQELERAALCHPDHVPEDVVALDCRVLFRLSGDLRIHARLLVHPYNLLCPKTEVSALSPVGTALLGLRLGDVMPFLDGGERRELFVEGLGMRFSGTGVPPLNSCHRTRAGAGHAPADRLGINA